MNLYYLHYNNYYNRIVKKFDTLGEYLTLPYYDNLSTENVAFNPNDGTETEQIVNIQSASFGYDYAILADGNNIVSRWFILKSKRLRNGQYRLNLRRDLFADLLEDVIDAPAFIEKAILEDNDPLIFNSENMTFNQIKTSETLLKDNSGCPWIVGYLAEGTSIPESEVVYQNPTTFANLSDFNSLWDSLRSTGLNKNAIVNENPEFNIDIYVSTSNINYRFNIPSSGMAQKPISNTGTASLTTNSTNNALYRYESLVKNNLTSFYDVLNNDYKFIPYSSLNSILEYDGKIVFDEDNNKFYKVKLNRFGGDLRLLTESPNLYNLLNSITEQNQYISGTPSSSSYEVNISSSYITKELVEVSGETIKYIIGSSNNSLQDAPYTMFAIPYGKCSFKYIENNIYVTRTIEESKGKAIATSIAFDIIKKLNSASGTADALYDIQLLPYCPLQNNIDADGKIVLDLDGYYDLVKDKNGLVVGFISFPIESRFSFNIPYNHEISDVKVQSECDMHRLCSPNWNGQFEFNAAKNGGILEINVDCEYKPFQPYIHLNPNFGKLYGQDFNDARGLICNGDFSLTQISNAWASYQRQNVNYEKIFNRQIENMEVNNSIQNIQSATQATLGVVGGTLGGFMAGGVGGAIAGGTASAIGGAMDYALQRASQAEAIDYTKDQFGYNLGNIKALPNSLTKVSAFNNNNKIFPVMEYYTCTEEEKEALRNKIKYNGMTVMRIGTIREFMKSEPSYIKGKLIRVTTAPEDYNYVNELANEFNKGVFI